MVEAKLLLLPKDSFFDHWRKNHQIECWEFLPGVRLFLRRPFFNERKFREVYAARDYTIILGYSKELIVNMLSHKNVIRAASGGETGYYFPL